MKVKFKRFDLKEIIKDKSIKVYQGSKNDKACDITISTFAELEKSRNKILSNQCIGD